MWYLLTFIGLFNQIVPKMLLDYFLSLLFIFFRLIDFLLVGFYFFLILRSDFLEFIAFLFEFFVEFDDWQVISIIFGQIIENTLVVLALIVTLKQLATYLIDFIVKDKDSFFVTWWRK